MASERPIREVVERLRERFQKKMLTKTSHGRNEIMDAFDKASQELAWFYLGEGKE